MIACARCGHENADGTAFCTECHAYLEWQPRTEASSPSDLAVTLESLPAVVVPGEQATGVVRVRNTGRIVDEFRLEVVGPIAGWTTVEPPVLRLFPRNGQVAQLVFKPPRTSASTAGMVTFGVRVYSGVRPEVSAVESGRLGVATFDDWQAQLRPDEPRGEAGAAAQVEVQNRGNAVLNVAISLGAPPAGVTVAGLPASLAVQPGQSGTLPVTLRAVGGLTAGQERRYPLDIVVESSTAASQRLRGTFVQAGPATRVEWYAQLDPASARGENGSQHRVQVMNRGNVAVPVALSVLDPSGALSLSVSPSSLTVPPGEIAEGVVTARAVRPVGAGQQARLPFEVLVDVREHGQVRLAGELVQVGPNALVSWQADLVPLASRSDWGAEHQIRVRNDGNLPLAVDVLPGAATRGLVLDGIPTTLTVPPGQVGEARVYVRATRRLPLNTEQVRPFEITVGPRGAMPASLRGTMTQVGSQAPVARQSCLGRLGLLLATLLVMGALGAFVTQSVTGTLEGIPFAVAVVALAALAALVLGALAVITGNVALRRLAVASASVVALAVLAALAAVAVALGTGQLSLNAG